MTNQTKPTVHTQTIAGFLKKAGYNVQKRENYGNSHCITVSKEEDWSAKMVGVEIEVHSGKYSKSLRTNIGDTRPNSAFESPEEAKFHLAEKLVEAGYNAVVLKQTISETHFWCKLVVMPEGWSPRYQQPATLEEVKERDRSRRIKELESEIVRNQDEMDKALKPFQEKAERLQAELAALVPTENIGVPERTVCEDPECDFCKPQA